MALTDQQQAELERLGPRIVQMRLDAAGGHPGSRVTYVVTGEVLRRDIEAWLAEQTHAEAEQRAETLRLARAAGQQQTETLRWAKIAGWAALAAVVLGIVVPLLRWLLAK